MKKLMIAACAIALAGVAQAYSVTWASTSGAFYDPAGSEGGWNLVPAGTTAYFVFASSYAQSDLVDDFAGAGANMTKLTAMKTGTVLDDGTVNPVTGSETSLTGSQNAYLVVFQTMDDKNYMFISDVVNKTIDTLNVTTYGFTDAEVDNAWTAAMDASAGYTTAGWYTAVPEPTSGLLLLLGVAGLALRRRRA